jgi:hypothetical protein
MQHCNRIVLGLSVVIAVALAAVSTPAHAAKGQWSLGGNFGTGLYSNGPLNDFLDSASTAGSIVPTLKHPKSGWEYGGSIRYGISPKASLDYELNLMNGKGKTDVTSPGTETVEVKTTGLAGPVSLYYELGRSDKSVFNFFVGVGPMFGTKFKITESNSSTSVTDEAKSKTGLYAHGGFEGDYMMSKSFAITARVLGRYAKAKNVTWTDPTDPSNVFVKDVNMSGAAFSIGLRAFFGK